MPLSDLQIRKASTPEKPQKLTDGNGLYLLLQPSGGKLWRFDYRYEGARKTLALGSYPDISLAKAREKHAEARRLLADGVDPCAERKIEKRARKAAAANSFESVARAWFASHLADRSESHKIRTMSRLESDVFPWLGKKPIADIEAPDLLEALRRVEARGAIETAHRIRRTCSQVFRYGVATGVCKRDPAADLTGALKPIKTVHFATITDPQRIGQLLRDIDGYDGYFPTRIAMQLAPLTFVRPGELRNAEWEEIDFENATWRIPAGKMKARAPHIIPLSKQAISLLQELQPLTGKGKYLFPSVRSNQRAMSENTVNAALRRLGYEKDEFTGHGFRGMFSTLANESHLWEPDAIERQLAHGEKDKVRAAYNSAQHLPQRKEMMQWWADQLDSMKQGAVIFKFRAA